MISPLDADGVPWPGFRWRSKLTTRAVLVTGRAGYSSTVRIAFRWVHDWADGKQNDSMPLSIFLETFAPLDFDKPIELLDWREVAEGAP